MIRNNGPRGRRSTELPHNLVAVAPAKQHSVSIIVPRPGVLRGWKSAALTPFVFQR